MRRPEVSERAAFCGAALSRARATKELGAQVREVVLVRATNERRGARVACARFRAPLAPPPPTRTRI